MPTAPEVSVGIRLRWIDAARGACVVAVVLHHVCLWQFPPLRDALWQPGLVEETKMDDYITFVRMPVLLAISGMLTARRISEGWARPGAAVRAASSYYLYVVWLALYFALDLIFSSVNPWRIGSISDFLTQLFLPETPLWYIFALALYVIMLTSVRRVPPWLMLGVLATLSVAMLDLSSEQPMWWWVTVPEKAVFFAVGVYGGWLLKALAARRRITDLLIAAVVALGCVVLAEWRVAPVADNLEHVLGGFVCIVLAAGFFPQVVRWRPLAAAGKFVGTRTLQIYLLHPPLILLLLMLLKHTGTDWLGIARRNPLVTTLWPIVLTLVIILLALLIHAVLERIRLGVLFDPPAAYTRAIIRLHGWLRAKRHPMAISRT
jgi:fucose 4-O-acetylase-like acetyltransferase